VGKYKIKLLGLDVNNISFDCVI